MAARVGQQRPAIVALPGNYGIAQDLNQFGILREARRGLLD